MTNYKGVIFNLDGIILNSLNIWKIVGKKFLKSKKMNIPINYEKTIINMNIISISKYIKEICGIEDTIDDITKQLKEIAYNEYKNKVNLKEGIYDYIMFLKQNDIKIAIIINFEKEFYEPCLKKYKIYNLFDIMIDLDINKNFFDIYNLYHKSLNIHTKDIILFDNTLERIKEAKKLGFRIYFAYDKYNTLNIEEALRESDEYITDFRELII